MTRIAVFGASGFVGATFVERALARSEYEIRAFIHSPGNAWRLARHGELKLETVDLLSRSSVREALRGCTHVVNCSRGTDETMTKGLKNLLKEAMRARVARFVHLSSVAVYGDPPSRGSESEDAPTVPEKNTYGWLKLRQDRMVESAAQAGLNCITLCPPNISGVQSVYLLGLIDALRSGRFALVDEGRLPCVLVDVENLAHAIDRALFHGRSDGRRLFITDDSETTWRDVVEALVPVAEPPEPCRSLTREEAWKVFRKPARVRMSPFRSMKHLLSGDVRSAMRKDPLLAKVDGFFRGIAAFLGAPFEDRFRLWLSGPMHVARVTDEPRLQTPLCAQQLRGVRHSCRRAKREIGYDPPVSFERSMENFRDWYDTMTGRTGSSGDLYATLWRR
jgi:nucleoside-diphosphate-sugar epimerase